MSSSQGNVISRVVPSFPSSRWIAGITVGVLMVVAAACSSGGASTPTSTNGQKTDTATHTTTAKPSGGYGY